MTGKSFSPESYVDIFCHYSKGFLTNVFTSFYWAQMDVRCRYRRSIIGPFWETINMLVMITGMSFVSSALFGADMISIVPYLGLGIIFWAVISNSINEGTGCFTGNAELIKNSNLGIGNFVGRTVFRIYITAAHHIVIYIIAVLFLDVKISWVSLLAIPGIIILFANSLWVVPALAMICARFRDLEMIVKNLVQLSFFVTPIFWNSDIVRSNRRFIVDYNPFYYFLEVIRAPLLGEIPQLHIYFVLFCITLFGYAFLAVTYSRMRSNLAFYV